MKKILVMMIAFVLTIVAQAQQDEMRNTTSSSKTGFSNSGLFSPISEISITVPIAKATIRKPREYLST